MAKKKKSAKPRTKAQQEALATPATDSIVEHATGKRFDKSRQKRALEAVTAKVAKGNAKYDASQKPLDGMDDVKIQPIETSIKKIVEAQSRRSALKEEIDGQLDKLVGLFKKHQVDQYSAHGRKVMIVPGGDVVKLQKVKTQ